MHLSVKLCTLFNLVSWWLNKCTTKALAGRRFKLAASINKDIKLLLCPRHIFQFGGDFFSKFQKYSDAVAGSTLLPCCRQRKPVFRMHGQTVKLLNDQEFPAILHPLSLFLCEKTVWTDFESACLGQKGFWRQRQKRNESFERFAS